MSFMAWSGLFDAVVIVHASVPSSDAVPFGPAGSSASPILPTILDVVGSWAGFQVNGQFIIIDALPAVKTFVASLIPTYEIEPGSVPALFRSSMSWSASTPGVALKIG